MKKIIFIGDSITDMNHTPDSYSEIAKMGFGYVYILSSYFATKYPQKFQLVNRGVAGDTISKMYAKVKLYAWNDKPDYLSILIGTNDVSRELNRGEEFDAQRFISSYRMLIEDTYKFLPNVKIILCCPAFGDFGAQREDYNKFIQAFNSCTQAIKQIATEFNLPVDELQNDFDVASSKYGVNYCYTDSLHPSVAGSKIIADNWIEAFEKTYIGEELQ